MTKVSPLAIVLAIATVSCTAGGASLVSGEGTPEPTPTFERGGPPPVTVRFFDRSIDLDAFTYCFETTCADGIPPENPPDVGSPDEVRVEFPLPGWTFTALFTPAGAECGRMQEVPLEQTGDGGWVLRPAGKADTYDVTLAGDGQGDLFVAFRWTTPTDGPLPQPAARLAVIAGHDGRVDSYGVELELRNLASTPTSASATITVREANGGAITFDARQSKINGCRQEGTVYWDGPDGKGRAAAALGDGPFTYEVVVFLDGARYEATAQWPADVIAGNEPSVALDFSPDLPALS